MNILTSIKKYSKKIYTFDIIFIVLAVLALGIFYVAFKRQVVYITVRAKMVDSADCAWGYVVGDKESDELGRTVSEIKNVYSYKISEDETAVFLDIKLKATYDPRTKVYSLKGKDIAFGGSLTIPFSKAHFNGFIVDFPGLSEALHVKNRNTVVKAQLRYDSRQFSDVYGAPEFLATALQAGDTMVDTQGNLLAKILDVTITPAKRIVVTNTGQQMVINDPDLKDVYYTIELSTKEINGKLYMFDYSPLLIGSTIPFNTHQVAVWPTITEIVN